MAQKHSPTPASPALVGPLCLAECMPFPAHVHRSASSACAQNDPPIIQRRRARGPFGTSKRLHNAVLRLLCAHLLSRGEMAHVHRSLAVCPDSGDSEHVQANSTHGRSQKSPLLLLWRASWTLGPPEGEKE